MSDDLFPFEKSCNALNDARRALELAIDEENRAEQIFEDQGQEAWEFYQDSTRDREHAERKVCELERKEIAKWNV